MKEFDASKESYRTTTKFGTPNHNAIPDDQHRRDCESADSGQPEGSAPADR